MTLIFRLFQFILLGLSLAASHLAIAESWPPLRPPDPLTVEWVIKQTLTRFPEVHAKHRAYLAALARAEAVPLSPESPTGGKVSGVPAISAELNDELRQLKRTLAEREADIVFADALEHHMMLQWQAHTAFLDYALAQETLHILDAHKRLVDAYLPATQARIHDGANDMTDLGLEGARLTVELIRWGQEKLNASWRMNTLMDRNWEAFLTPVKLGEPTALPANREGMVGRALNQSPTARKSRAQAARAAVRLKLANTGDKEFLPKTAVTHELAGAEDQQRGVNTTIVRDVTLAYENARVKLDMTKHHNHTILPRVRQLATAATVGYRNRQMTMTQLIQRYRAQTDAELEALRVRIEYEKSLADLAQHVGVLPEYAIRTMSERPLNTSREPRAQ